MCNPTCKATTVLNVAMAILEASLGSAQDIGAAVCEIVAARPRTSQRQHINLCFDLLRWWWWLGTLALDMTSTIYGFRLTRWSIDVHSTHMEKNGRKSIRRASAASVRNHSVQEGFVTLAAHRSAVQWTTSQRHKWRDHLFRAMNIVSTGVCLSVSPMHSRFPFHHIQSQDTFKSKVCAVLTHNFHFWSARVVAGSQIRSNLSLPCLFRLQGEKLPSNGV